jgi:hypothetical protein
LSKHNKNIISLASSLGQLLTGWRFAQYSQQVIAPYVKRYMKWSFMKFLGVFLALSLSACTYSAGSGGVNSQDCSQVQRECLHGVYSEWFQKNGDLACTCSGT